jgi:NTP pyrophosphatase (non-canonical NTP hydrolase)
MMEEMEIEPMYEEEANQIADKVNKYQSQEKNTLKVVEECAELSEVMIKFVTKQPEDKPSIEKIIEEMGDVHARCYILARQLGICDDVINRVASKLRQLDGWMSERYEGVV